MKHHMMIVAATERRQVVHVPADAPPRTVTLVGWDVRRKKARVENAYGNRYSVPASEILVPS